MADFVTIANLAASALEEDDQLRSPSDDTHLARSVRAVWDLERRAALRDHSWNFAMRRAALPAVANENTAPYAAGFRLPADCVRLIEVLTLRRSDYQLEGRLILTGGKGPLNIRYITDVTEPALWDDLFVKAFAMRVAWQVAGRITGDPQRAQLAERRYWSALKEAKRVDARENPPVAFEATEWERARGAMPERVDRNGLVWP